MKIKYIRNDILEAIKENTNFYYNGVIRGKHVFTIYEKIKESQLKRIITIRIDVLENNIYIIECLGELIQVKGKKELLKQLKEIQIEILLFIA